MRQRAHRVQLKPEIEQACLKDLGMYCSDADDPGANQVGFFLKTNPPQTPPPEKLQFALIFIKAITFCNEM